MQLAELFIEVAGQVWTTLQHNWPFLVVSVLVASAMRLYLKTDNVAAFLRRHQKGGVVAATAVAVGTPLCSCGTTAIVLGMMAGSMPWAPIIAFMVASPLTSPEELIYSAGLFGWPFAMAFFAASIVLGLAGGLAGALLDARGWLRNQNRFGAVQPACECAQSQVTAAANADSSGPRASARSATVMPLPQQWNYAATLDSSLALTATGGAGSATLCCDAAMPLFAVAPTPCACAGDVAGVIPLMPAAAARTAGASSTGASRTGAGAADALEATSPRFQWRPFLLEVAYTGRRLLLMFLGFAAIGYLINDLIPATWITALFGSGHAYSVPLAATLGLPFYINSEASLPLVRGMLDAGMSSGAALAFLITGAGTSIGAVAGAMTIARWRVVGIVIATLWLGATACGFAFDALSAAALF